MEKKRVSTRFIVGLIPIIALVIFNIIVFAIIGKKMDTLKDSFWCGYSFIMIGFVAITGTIMSSKLQEGQIFSQKFPMFILAFGYVILNLVINVIAMAVNNNKSLVAFISIDCILILIYIALVLGAYIGLRHISENRAEVQKKVNYLNKIKAEVEVLLERAISVELKTELKGLLEDVTYSDAMSGNEVEVEEKKIIDSLDSISDSMDLLDAGSDEMNVDTIKQMVVKTKILLKKRNALVKASKS